MTDQEEAFFLSNKIVLVILKDNCYQSFDHVSASRGCEQENQEFNPGNTVALKM